MTKSKVSNRTKKIVLVCAVAFGLLLVMGPRLQSIIKANKLQVLVSAVFGGTTPDASAIADFISTTKGILPPRLTTTQRDAMVLPATGLLIFNTSVGAAQENIGTPASPNWAGVGGGGQTTPIVIIFAGGIDPHADTNSASYVVIGILHFGGTAALGTPTKIKAVGFKDGSPTSWDFRILDITNATTIVEKTGNTGTVAEIVDAGALSNLPAAEAMFEVQMKRTGGAGGSEVHMYSLSMEF